jgi:hypothetical protein
MTALSHRVESYFATRSWPTKSVGDATVALPVVGANGDWTMFVNRRDTEQQVMVHGVFARRVPVRRRKEIAMLLTRANFGLVIGNFELDLDDGELRYKTSIDVEDAELTEALLDHLVLANVATMDRYLPAIEAVIAGARADDAIREVDG